MPYICLLAIGSFLGQTPSFRDIPNELTVPAPIHGEAAAGRRVFERFDGFGEGDAAHVLYLPTDWRPGTKYPVLVEYPGNGGYKNALGDTCSGKPEDCRLGYGVSGGKGMIWVCLPFVDAKKKHSITWWGDADATAAYCRGAVERMLAKYGGDPERVVLMGFSRGAIACNYIGLRDDATAKLWRAFVVHSHYDGVRKWPYADSDRDSAQARLARLNGRPQFVSHETTVAETQKYLKGIENLTFVSLPFPNHTDEWMLKDLPERRQVREWLANAIR